MPEMTEVRNPDFPGLRLLPDEIGAARITQNCDLYKQGQLDSRFGYRHANHRRYNGGVVAIIDVQRICDYGKILICSGWEGDPDTEVFEHTETVGPGWGGPYGPGVGGGDAFWDKGFPPVAVPLADPVVGQPPLLVQFNGENSFDPDGGPIVSYEWDFGDGSPLSNEVNPQHVYNGNQVFTATLTVVDNEGRVDLEGVDIDTRDVIVAADFGANILTSVDGGLNFGAAAGVPAVGQHVVLGANGYVFAFVINVANTDVYRSEDGLNFVLVSTFAGNIAWYARPILGHNGRILAPCTGGAGPSVAYSDDNGDTWNVVLIGASANTAAPSMARMSGNGRLVCAKQNAGGGGSPIDIYVSANNGQAWALTAATFGDSAQPPIVGACQNNRIVIVARAALPGNPSQIQTSDDNGATWQLRETIALPNTPCLCRFWGAEGLGMESGATGLRHSVNNATNFAAAVFPSAWCLDVIRRADGYFAAGFGGLYFTAALPNFAIRGAAGIWLYTVATLRDQET